MVSPAVIRGSSGVGPLADPGDDEDAAEREYCTTIHDRVDIAKPVGELTGERSPFLIGQP